MSLNVPQMEKTEILTLPYSDIVRTTLDNMVESYPRHIYFSYVISKVYILGREREREKILNNVCGIT